MSSKKKQVKGKKNSPVSQYTDVGDARTLLLAFQKYLGAAEQIDVDLATFGSIDSKDIDTWCHHCKELKNLVDHYIEKHGSTDQFPFGNIGDYQHTLNSLWNKALADEKGRTLSLGPLINSGNFSKVKNALESNWKSFHKLPPLF